MEKDDIRRLNKAILARGVPADSARSVLMEMGASPADIAAALAPPRVILPAPSSGGSCGGGGAANATRIPFAKVDFIDFAEATATAAGIVPLKFNNLQGLDVSGRKGPYDRTTPQIRIFLLRDPSGIFSKLKQVQNGSLAPENNVPTVGIPSEVMTWDQLNPIQYGYRYLGGVIQQQLNIQAEVTGAGTFVIGLASGDSRFLKRANNGVACSIDEDEDY